MNERSDGSVAMDALQHSARQLDGADLLPAEPLGRLFNGQMYSSLIATSQAIQSGRRRATRLLDDLRNLEEVVVTCRSIGAQRLRSGRVGDDVVTIGCRHVDDVRCRLDRRDVQGSELLEVLRGYAPTAR